MSGNQYILKIPNSEIAENEIVENKVNTVFYYLFLNNYLITFLYVLHFQYQVYYHWFNTDDDFDVRWRDKWRLIISKITNILGGDYVIYIADVSAYSPHNYCFPKEMEEQLQIEIKNSDQLVSIISEKLTKFQTLAEADKKHSNNEKKFFVIDRFDDLDKTLKI